MYRTSWLAKRIVNLVADDMTGEWRDFQFGDADDNPQIEALQKAEKQYGVQSKFNSAIRWGRLYGGCLVILGTKDVSSTQDMMEPLDVESVGKGDLKYIHVLDRWRCSPSGEVVTDMDSPMFGMPVSYIIAESSVQIHHTRVIRFGGEELPYFECLRNARWDDSVLQHTLDSLKNYDSTSAAIATMIFEANVDVIKSGGDLTELLSTKDGENRLRKRFSAAAIMKSFNRTLLLSAEEEYEKKQNSFTNLADIWERFATDVSGACEIPTTRLFGESPGGLNSPGDGELQNYYKFISGKQQTTLRPQLEYFDEIFVRSVLGTVPDDYDFEFNSLWEMNDKDEAMTDYQRAQRDQIYLTAGVITPGLAASELKARGTYSSMSSEDVELAEELSEQTVEVREAGAEAQVAQHEATVANPTGEADSGAMGQAKKSKSKTSGAKK
jgi:phage-related protein (TIGR01555 family)